MSYRQQPRLTRFRVEVGHSQVIVLACDAVEAVREARLALGRDMPRLWDVIHQLDDGQFVVQAVWNAGTSAVPFAGPGGAHGSAAGS
ncbi:MAG: hypothetical protein K2Y37_08990 [Pirellulales bacterium]|nr:hypothetical protein [Pirellulales bacterium]